MSRAFRGVATDAQLARFVDFFTTAWPQVGIGAGDGRSGRSHADVAQLRLPRRGADRRRGQLMPAQRLQSLTYTLPTRRPKRWGSLRRRRRVSSDAAELSQKTIDRLLATPEARAKLAAILHGLARGEGARRIHDRQRACFPSSRRRSPRRWCKKREPFLKRQLAARAPSLQDVTAVDPVASSREAAPSIYGGSGVGAPPDRSRPRQRLGIFTQPAVIASHSGPTHDSAGQARRVLHPQGDVPAARCSRRPASTPTIPQAAAPPSEQRVETVHGPSPVRGLSCVHQPVRVHAGELRRDRSLPHDRSGRADRREHPGRLPRRGPARHQLAGRRAARFHPIARFQQCFARQLFRFYTGRDETAGDDPVLRQMFFDFAERRPTRHRRHCCAPWPAPRPCPSDRRHHDAQARSAHPSRPDQVLRRRSRSC